MLNTTYRNKLRSDIDLVITSRYKLFSGYVAEPVPSVKSEAPNTHEIICIRCGIEGRINFEAALKHKGKGIYFGLCATCRLTSTQLDSRFFRSSKRASVDMRKDSDSDEKLVDNTTQIVAAYVSHTSIPSADVPVFIQNVFKALASLKGGGSGDAAASAAVATAQAHTEPAKPVVPPKKSVFPDYIICLDDGKKLKSLKRHIMAKYKLTPQAYREKWGLPADYPMVAPNYSKRRSELALAMGLGEKRRKYPVSKSGSK